MKGILQRLDDMERAFYHARSERRLSLLKKAAFGLGFIAVVGWVSCIVENHHLNEERQRRIFVEKDHESISKKYENSKKEHETELAIARHEREEIHFLRARQGQFSTKKTCFRSIAGEQWGY